MDIQVCLRKLGYKAVVWDNSYEGIKPHVLETRPIPTMDELKKAWIEVEADRVKAEVLAKANAEREALIQSKMREQAIAALKIEGKL